MLIVCFDSVFSLASLALDIDWVVVAYFCVSSSVGVGWFLCVVPC